MRLAGDLGAEAVIVCPGKPNPLFPMPAAEMTAHFFSALDELAPIAGDAGVALRVENMAFALLPLASQRMEALATYGDDVIGVVYDVANGVYAGEDPVEGLRLVRSRLRLVHLSAPCARPAAMIRSAVASWISPRCRPRWKRSDAARPRCSN